MFYEPMECTELRDFTVLCLFETQPWENKETLEEKKKIRKYWDNAESVNEFRSSVLNDESLNMLQGYAELSKETENHWYRIRAMFGDRCFKTESDAGSVLVSYDSNFSVQIPNYLGDGITRCAVFQKGEKFNKHMMNYTGISITGNMFISNYDCTFNPVKELNGKYLVYAYEGLVAFVES